MAYFNMRSLSKNLPLPKDLLYFVKEVPDIIAITVGIVYLYSMFYHLHDPYTFDSIGQPSNQCCNESATGRVTSRVTQRSSHESSHFSY